MKVVQRAGKMAESWVHNLVDAMVDWKVETTAVQLEQKMAGC